MSAIRSLLTVLLLAMIATVTFADPKAGYPDISKEELSAAIKSKKVAVLDCNGSKSFKEAHIPGAIDFEANQKKLATLLPKDKDTLIVAYCGGPKCNAYNKGADAAKALGYKNIKHLSAGISGWASAKLPTEK